MPPQGEEGRPDREGEKDASGRLELTEEELRLVQTLAARDREVRTHEQAHQSVGGQYAGSPSYTYESGPDGKRYAVGGEVPIDVGEAADPAETIRKMEVVRRAALAPAEPSGQDRAVAAQAGQVAARARAELQQQQAEEAAEAREDDAEGAEAEGAEADGAGEAAEAEGAGERAGGPEAASAPAPEAAPTSPSSAPSPPPAAEAPPPAPSAPRTLDFAPRKAEPTGTFLHRSASEQR
ncbi:MAG: hypothetical protein H6704_15865 [Myxococcales bacterium]|nr:hypothetical protein [Myxococcales bacterium]